MSGPSTLGTLLSQRLDAVMGQTLAKHAALLDTRPSAAAQPVERSQSPTPIERRQPDIPLPGQGRAGRGRADATAAGTRLGRESTAVANRQSAEAPPASARATLSAAARLILTLLADRSQSGPGQISARQPLWRPSADMPGARPTGPGMPQDANTANTQRPAVGGRPAAGAAAAGAGAAANNNTGTAAPNRAGSEGTAAQNARPGAAGNQVAGQPAATPAGANTAQSGQTTAPAGLPGAQPAPGATPPASTPALNAPAPAPAGPAAAGAAQTASAATNDGMPPAHVFVRALSHALQSSGLFYESHLAKVAFGKMPADELLREPQARFAALRGDTAASSTSAQAHQAAPAPGTPSSTANMPPEAAAMIRQQLETLAQSALHWNGEAWPGAPMEWEVADETHDADPHARHWATRLSISLPNLGLVEARIQLSGMQLVMHLDAPDSAELLQAEGEVLRDRYSAGGFTLSSFQVGDDAVAAPGSSATDARSSPAQAASDARTPFNSADYAAPRTSAIGRL